MSSITIHAPDPILDRRLAEEAMRCGKSKNQMVKDLLARALGLPVEGRHTDDYCEFCGLWSVEERAAFDALQAGNSRVDPSDWER